MSKHVCIIGAGAAGIAAAYALDREGLTFDWFEAGTEPCGLWRYRNDSGMSAVYESLKTNTSAPNMTLFGYRLRQLGNDYLSHRQVVQYLESFLDHAGLRRNLRLATRVTAVEPDGTRFRVAAETRTGDAAGGIYDAVIVAHGRNWSPALPRLKGSFGGRFLHALDYKTPEILRGRRVVVMGFGNTGADIAVDAAGCAAQVLLSTRTGGHLSFRYANGQPADQSRSRWSTMLPRIVRRELARIKLRRRGLSDKVVETLEQGARFRAKPPVINDNIDGLIDAGKIQVRPGAVAVDGSRVYFADGSQTEADVIIAATGYKTSYPFFSPEILERNQDFHDRYWRVVAPGQPGLYFVGHAAVVGPVFPVLEAQAQWVAAIVAGKCALPEPAALWKQAGRQSKSNAGITSGMSRGEDTVETYPYIAGLPRIPEPAGGVSRPRTEPAVAAVYQAPKPPVS